MLPGLLMVQYLPCGRPLGNMIAMLEEARSDEQDIREGEARLRALFQHIQTGIVIIDPETHVIVDINPIAAELIGIAPEEIVGSVCHQYICPAAVGKCPITDLGQTLERAERVLIRADRSRVAILKTVTSVELGGRPYLVESFVDITDTKIAEDRKLALLAYTSESVMRVHKPLEIMQDSLLFLAEQAERGELEPGEIATALRVQMNHAGQMLATLQDLKQAVMSERGELTPQFREFLLGGGQGG
jgi:PAS domain S-box-containing protein